MVYQGYLELGGDEVVNAPRTLAYAASEKVNVGLQGCEDCDSMEQALAQDNYTTPALDPAPWYDASDPSTGDFLGAYPLSIDGIEDTSRQVDRVEQIIDGGVVTGSRRTSKEIRVDTVLVGKNKEGVLAGLSWLTNVLDRSCQDDPGCQGDDLKFFSSCPPEIPGPISNTPVNYQGTGTATEMQSWSIVGTGTIQPFAGGGGFPAGGIQIITTAIPNFEDDGNWDGTGSYAVRTVTGLVPGLTYQMRTNIYGFGQNVRIEIGDSKTWLTTWPISDLHENVLLDFVATSTTMQMKFIPINFFPGDSGESFIFDVMEVRRIVRPAILLNEPYVNFTPPSNGWQHDPVGGDPNPATVWWQHNEQLTSITVRVETDSTSSAIYTTDAGPHRTVYGLTPGDTYKVYVGGHAQASIGAGNYNDFEVHAFMEGAASWSTTFEESSNTAFYQEIEFVAEDTTAIVHIRQPGDNAVVRTNMIYDPGLRSTTWPRDGSTGPQVRSTTGGARNVGYMKYTLTASNAARMGLALTPSGLNAPPVVAGQQYTVSGWYRRSGTAGGTSIGQFNNVAWYNAGGALISSVDGAPVVIAVSGNWIRVSNTFTAPAGATFGRPAAIWSGSYPVGAVLSLSSFMMEHVATVGSYFDGNLLGTWVGDPNASMSTYNGTRANMVPNPAGRTPAAGGAPWIKSSTLGTTSSLAYFSGFNTHGIDDVTTAISTSLPAGTPAGANSLWLSHPSTSAGDFIGIAPGESLSVAGLTGNSGNVASFIRIAWFAQDGGGALSTTAGTVALFYDDPTGTDYYWGTAVGTAPSGADRARIEIGWTSGGTPTYPNTLFATALIAEVGRGTTIATSEYFDGDSFGAEWKHTPYSDASATIVPTLVTLNTNYVTDPRLRTTTMTTNGATVVDTRPTSGGPFLFGSTSAYFRRTITVANTTSPMSMSFGGTGTGGMPVTAGQTYTGSFYAQKSAGGPGAQINLTWYNSGGGVISIVSGAVHAPTTTWDRFSDSFVAPALAAFVQMRLGWTGTALVAQTLDFANIMWENNLTASDYFDGNSPSASWTGTPDASTSILQGAEGMVIMEPNSTVIIQIDNFVVEEDSPTDTSTPRTGLPYERVLYEVQALDGPTVQQRFRQLPDCAGYMMRVVFSLVAGQPHVYRLPVFAGGLPSGASTVFDEVDCLYGQEVRYNYAINGSGEGALDAAGYDSWSSPYGTVDTPIVPDPISGLQVVRWDFPSTGSSGNRYLNMVTDVTPATGVGMVNGGLYVASGWIRSNTARDIIPIVLIDGVTLNSGEVIPLLANTWTHIDVPFALPSSGALNTLLVQFNTDSLDLAAGVVDADAWMIESGQVSGPYFDNLTNDSMGVGSFTGTAYASTIVLTPIDTQAPIQDPDCPQPPAPPAPPAIVNDCIVVPDTWLRTVLEVNPTQIPGNTVAAPILTITAGDVDVNNARVRFWRAEPGQTIDDLSQCDFDGEIFITYIPANGVMTINGITRIATIDGRPANHLIYGSDSGPVDWPLLRCSDAYFITLDLDPDNSPGATMTVDLAIRDY